MDVWSEWKEHNGGECPIPDAKAWEWEGRTSSGSYGGGFLPARGSFWRNVGNCSDITHYRTRVPLESLVGRRDGPSAEACSRQAPEAATPGTNPATTPDREHLCVMVSDEPGIVRAALADLAGNRFHDDVDWIRSACTSPGEAKEAPPLPVAGFDHRLGAWR